jgi:Na+/H+-dicarboxylate symporter
VTVFKVQSAFINPFRFVFLAHVFGVSITFSEFVAFALTMMLISFTSLGVPNGGSSFRVLPAFLAMGIPVEGVVMTTAMKDFLDHAFTLANTSGQFAGATILSRAEREGAGGGD